MTSALIAVDVQNDFITGSLAIPRSGHIPAAIRDHIAASDYDCILATQDWHIDPGDHFSEAPDFIDSWPVHCVRNTVGAEIHEALAHAPFDGVFRKGRYSAAYSGFEGTDASEMGYPLDFWLTEHGVTHVDIVGLAFDYCVKATALDAVKRGYVTRVLESLTQAVSDPAQARREMQDAGVIFG